MEAFVTSTLSFIHAWSFLGGHLLELSGHQRKPLKEVRVVDGDVLVLHVLPPFTRTMRVIVDKDARCGKGDKTAAGCSKCPTVVRMRVAPQLGGLLLSQIATSMLMQVAATGNSLCPSE